MYSFSNFDGSSCSSIDYFLVSVGLLQDVKDLTICDSGLNLSDHCPVIIRMHNRICLDDHVGNGFMVNNNCNRSLGFRARWDKANLREYYNLAYTCSLLSRASLGISACFSDEGQTFSEIEELYKSPVDCLSDVAALTVPKKRFIILSFGGTALWMMLRKSQSMHTEYGVTMENLDQVICFCICTNVRMNIKT